MRSDRNARRGIGLAAVAGLALAGCVSAGEKFDVAAVRRIEIGETNRTQVRQMFGDPWRTGVDDGQKTWTFGHYRYSLFSDAETRDLVIRFDDKGIVRSFTFNSTYPEDRDL
jgi:outer membrane protein assembly factor BamE (lipoprotein component of BamABCDE complex)